jgi:hypothetical protein
MFSVAIWVVVSVLSVICLLGFFLVYRKLSSVRHELIVLSEGTASFAHLQRRESISGTISGGSELNGH